MFGIKDYDFVKKQWFVKVYCEQDLGNPQLINTKYFATEEEAFELVTELKNQSHLKTQNFLTKFLNFFKNLIK